MQGHMISLPYTPQVLHCRYVGDITSDVSILWGLSGRLSPRVWLLSTLKPPSGLWIALSTKYITWRWKSVRAGPHILLALETVVRGPLATCKNCWPPFLIRHWIMTNSSLSKWLFHVIVRIFLLLNLTPTPLSNFLLSFFLFPPWMVSSPERLLH